VLRTAEPGEFRQLPRVWLGAAAEGIEPGAYLSQDEGGSAVRALAGVPASFPDAIETVRGVDGSLAFLLPDGLELRLGSSADLRLKLEAAAAVLGSLTGAEREALAYLDVSLPARPVGGQEAQLEG
jgi:hypothetical protein